MVHELDVHVISCGVNDFTQGHEMYGLASNWKIWSRPGGAPGQTEDRPAYLFRRTASGTGPSVRNWPSGLRLHLALTAKERRPVETRSQAFESLPQCLQDQ